MVKNAVLPGIDTREDIRPAVRRDQRRLREHVAARTRMHQSGNIRQQPLPDPRVDQVTSYLLQGNDQHTLHARTISAPTVAV